MLVETWVKGLYPGLRVDAFERTISFSRGTWRNSDAHRHIECAHLCGRLELAGASVNKIAKECGITRATIWNWSKDPAFRAEKARARAAFRVDLSDIPLTHRRDRIEVAAAIAMDEDARPDTRLRALKYIADEAAADTMGMVAHLQEQIDLFERQIAGDFDRGLLGQPPGRTRTLGNAARARASRNSHM